jgi:ribosomal protein L32
VLLCTTMFAYFKRSFSGTAISLGLPKQKVPRHVTRAREMAKQLQPIRSIVPCPFCGEPTLKNFACPKCLHSVAPKIIETGDQYKGARADPLNWKRRRVYKARGMNNTLPKWKSRMELLGINVSWR